MKGLMELANEDSQLVVASSQLVDITGYIHQARGSMANGHRMSMGRVPYTEYWLMRDNQYVGAIQIRHEPSGRHQNLKSHIYYQIIPSERGKGYGKMILKLGLQKARRLGLREVLLTTDSANSRSRSIIETCGGLLLKQTTVPDSKTSMLQYKINLNA